MRSSFKFILCLISADIIIITMALLLSLTGVLNVNSSQHKSDNESDFVSDAETNDITEMISDNDTDDNAEQFSDNVTDDNTEQLSDNITDDNTEQLSGNNINDNTEKVSDSEAEDTSTVSEETTTEFDKNTFVVINNTSTVYLRKDASVSGEIICELPSGATGTIISKKDEWSKVSFEDKTGYVFNEYIVDGSAASDFITATNTASVIINSSCYMRDNPDTESPVTGTAPAGKKYQYIPESSDSLWFAIITEDGSIKYISTGYADIVKTGNR